MTELSRILDDVKHGDRSAWKSLVAQVGPRLYRIARAVTRDGALAEDAVQEVFLRLAERRFPRLAKGAAEAYLSRAVTRAAIDGLRRRRTRNRREEEHAMSRNNVERTADPLLAAELSEQVGEALAVLPAETRAALWLHVVEGEAIREVARCVGLARSTVADRIRDGKDRIRRFLKGRGYLLPVAVSWSALLRDSQAGELPRGLTDTLEAMGSRLAAPRGSLVSGSDGYALVSAVLSGKKAAVMATVGILLGLGVTLLLTDSRQPDAPLPEAELEARPLARAEPARVELPAGPVPEATTTSVQEESVTEELIVVDGIIFDRETFAPIADATIAPSEEIQGPPVTGATWTATSEADGHYRLLLPVSVEARFVAAARGYLAESRFIRGTDARWSDDSSFYNFPLLPELEVRGWVVDADDRPLEDAVLYISGTAVGTSTTYLNRPEDGNVRSKEDGSFVLPMAMYGQPRVVVYKEGYGGTVAVGTPPSVSEFTIRVPPGATVSGTVIGPDGRPRAGERVLWTVKEPSNARWQGDAVTDDSGAFILRGLPAPAAHTVFAGRLTSGAFDSWRAEQAAKSNHGAFARTVELTPGGELTDVVLDLGALERWQQERDAERSDERGSRVVTMDPARSTTRPLHIHGTVVDGAGVAAHRARVDLHVLRATARGYAGSYVRDTLTDEQGRFSYFFESLPAPARYKVVVTVSHFAWATTRETLDELEVDDGPPANAELSTVSAGPYSLALRPACNLTGRVADPSGTPVPGAQVIELRERDGIPGRKAMQFFGRTDEAGGFDVPRRDPEEEIRLAFFHPAYVLLEIQRPAPGRSGAGAHDLGVLTLISGGTIEGIALGADGSPLPYARVTVAEREFQPPALADESGRFVLEHVAPGRRELRVLLSDADHPWKRGSPVAGDAVVEVADGMRYQVQVRVEEPAPPADRK